jgi:hypothetical protein
MCGQGSHAHRWVSEAAGLCDVRALFVEPETFPGTPCEHCGVSGLPAEVDSVHRRAGRHVRAMESHRLLVSLVCACCARGAPYDQARGTHKAHRMRPLFCALSAPARLSLSPSLPPSLSPLLHEMFETPITFIQIHVLHAQSSEVRRTPRASLSLCASPVEHQFLISVTAHSFCADLPANNNSIPPTLPPSTAMGPRPTPHSPCFAACQLGSRVAVSPPCACPLPVGASFLATPPSVRHSPTFARSNLVLRSQSFLQARSFVAHAFAHRERLNPVNAASIACVSSHATDASTMPASLHFRFHSLRRRSLCVCCGAASPLSSFDPRPTSLPSTTERHLGQCTSLCCKSLE